MNHLLLTSLCSNLLCKYQRHSLLMSALCIEHSTLPLFIVTDLNFMFYSNVKKANFNMQGLTHISISTL